MMLVILFLKLELLVKVASSVLILLYIFANLTLILFRESKISSYKPKFRSPFYPYMQILGMLGGFFLLIEMGTFIIFLTLVFLLLGFIWYKVYAQKRVSQDSALMHVLERLVAKDKELASEHLLSELKDIVIQRDEIVIDKFHKLIEKSKLMDIENPLKAEEFFKKVSVILSKELKLSSKELFKKLMQREKEVSTVIKKGIAIPHIIVKGKNIFKIILVRAKTGVIFPDDQLIHIAFVLVGSSDEPGLHLKNLAAIAQITQNPEFEKKWLKAKSERELKNIILLAERERS